MYLESVFFNVLCNKAVQLQYIQMYGFDIHTVLYTHVGTNAHKQRFVAHEIQLHYFHKHYFLFRVIYIYIYIYIYLCSFNDAASSADMASNYGIINE
jgi:hypothetical protein